MQEGVHQSYSAACSLLHSEAEQKFAFIMSIVSPVELKLHPK